MKKNKTKVPVTKTSLYVHHLTFQGPGNIVRDTLESDSTMLTQAELLRTVTKLFGTQGTWALTSHVVVSK